MYSGLVGVLVRVLGPHDDRRRACRRPHPSSRTRRRPPAISGALQMVSMLTSLRNCARGLQVRRSGGSSTRCGRAPHASARRRRRTSCRRPGAHMANIAAAVSVRLGAVGRRPGRADEALVAAVLHLLDADGHRHVVGAARDRVRGVAQRLGAGGAEVLDPRDRLVVELQRAGERHAAHARHRGAEPVRVDVVLVRARPSAKASSVDLERGGRRCPCPSARRSVVQPMPTMATWSLMPCDPMVLSLALCGPGDPARGRSLAVSPGWGGPSRSSCGCRRR